MAVRVEPHITDDEIEGYSLGALAAEPAALLEEHLLVCESCRQRLSESDEFVRAMEAGAARLRREPVPDRPLARLVAVFAGAAILVLTALIWVRSRPAEPPVATVTLNAARETGVVARAAANYRLSLAPELTGLPASPKYRVEVVGASGAYLWQGSYPGAVLGPLAPGMYFVRIYSPRRDLSREYALQVEKPQR
jgi:anti-sigma factor RsiW